MVERRYERIENFEKKNNIRFLCENNWMTVAKCPECPNPQLLKEI